MASLVQEYRQKLERRADELRPLVAELHEIEEALASFPKSSRASTRAGARSTTRPGKRTASGRRAPKRRRRATAGLRSQQVLEVVKANPGISVSEMAQQLGVASTGLYPVTRKLVADGKLRKKGTAYRTKR